MKSYVALINFFDMQFIFASLLKNASILILLINTFIVKQAIIYIERKKTLNINFFQMN